ncbi:MAG: hypothetical protein O9282_11730 [Flavobacterium sp.]|uniref:hypothetical protein n=1 Tax=Flavobacterium TaxID=237 RepID=UPI0022BB1BCC|nr:hypothetical protein [Flavobacterium sp.]MCZ8331972.1 hypothetical protein [Flavobacterium sp.]
MNKLHKEGIYFVLTLIISLIAFVLLFGIENIKSGDLVLNVHSTYFVIKATHFLIVFLPLFFSITYLIRTAVLKFKNLYSNLVYIVSNGLLILLILSVILNNSVFGFKPNLNLYITILILLILEILILIKTIKLKKHCS